VARTTVINIKDAPEGWEQDERYVYIGRECRRGGHDLDASPFANPYRVNDPDPDDRNRPMDRQRCIDLFREALCNCPELVERIRTELPGKTLVCWCKPLPCHGDVIAAIANGGVDVEYTR